MAPPQSTPARPAAVGPQGIIARPPAMPQPGMPPYVMVSQGPNQYPMMGYHHPQGFYPGFNSYEQQNFAMPPQWAPPHRPQGQFAGSYNARPMSPSQSSPVPFQTGQSPLPVNGLVGGNGPSGTQSPSIRPPVLGHHTASSNASSASIPSTPNRPMNVSAPSFTHMTAGSATFTPRRSAAIKIMNPEDGTEVDLKAKAAAKARAFPPSSAANSPASTPASVTPGLSTPEVAKAELVRKPLSLPVVVKIEKPEENARRLAEEKKVREEEERDARERKERLERRAKEEQEKKLEEENEQKSKDVATPEEAEERDTSAEDEAKPEEAKPEEAKSEEAKSEEAKPEEAKSEEAKIDDAPHSLPTLVAAAAGLPPKPVAPVNGVKPTPAPLDLQKASPSIDDEPTPIASSFAIDSARSIEDIHSITYPGSLKSPNPELNAAAQPGKFRYDRDFLIQFMALCKEKPANLPNLAEIGLEADGSSGFGSRGPRGGRSSMGPSSRSGGASTGLGIGGIGRASMGSFGTGQFGSMTGGSLRNSTSEQRYRASLSGGRTPSQGGLPPMSGLPSMGLSNSRSGTARGSQRGSKRIPQAVPTPAATPIPISENAWTRTRLGGDAEGTPAFIERKVKALLNKLTEEKFDSISKQILEWANKSKNETDGLTLKLVIKLIFEKATDEAHWSAMYAKLCKLLHDGLDAEVAETINGKVVSGRELFRKYLLGRCQVDFESGWKAREDTAVAAAAKEKEDGVKQEQAQESGDKEADLMSDEYYAAQKAKRRGLGLVQLIGELFKMGILTNRVMSECLIRLLSNVTEPDEEDIESASKLLTTVGGAYEKNAPENVRSAFMRLEEILKVEGLPSRIQFMILDVIDLRKNGWRSRKQQTGVMTIAEIHKQNAQEKSAAAVKESMSRGGSRTGRDRREGGQTGEWQSVQSGARSISRPTDFSGMGRNISSSGGAPSFTSSSVFANRKGKTSGITGTATPPISRQPSSNMFSALKESHEVDSRSPAGRTGVDAGEPGPQRPRILLAPRTKPLSADDAADAAQAPGRSDDEDEDAEMSDEEIKGKIDLDMKELWGEKDQGGSRNPTDIADYFRSLPESRRGVLAGRLLEDVFRISKMKEAEIVAKGWRTSLDQQIVTLDVLKLALEGRMPSLDDDSLDFPAAYTAIAVIIRSIELSSEDAEALGEKIDVEGTPRVTPQQKLQKALVKYDEEASTA